MSSVICRHEPREEEKGKRTVGLLHQWAEENKVNLTEIPSESSPTPDYRAEFPEGIVLIIEVKEVCLPFESVREDSGEIVNRLCQEGVVDLKDLARPLRAKIKSANKQLRPYSDEGVATLTLIGVWNPCLEFELDFLPLATTGDNRIRLGGTPFILQGKSGGQELGGKMNTSTSGVLLSSSLVNTFLVLLAVVYLAVPIPGVRNLARSSLERLGVTDAERPPGSENNQDEAPT